MDKTLYIDVTQLIHWQGRMAGIPRVMYELSTRFKSHDDQQVVFVSWVKEVRAFCEIDFPSTVEKLGQGIVYIKEDGQKAGTPSRQVHITEVFKPLKHLAKKVIVRAGLSDTGLVKKAQNNLAAAEAQAYRKITFKKGDAIFISWGEWWDDNFLRTLEEGVHDTNLKIIPVIHDVLPFTQTPQFSGHSTESLMNYCRRIVPVSALVLSVSHATQEDLRQWLVANDIDPPHMEVFRLGEDFKFAKSEMPTDENFAASGAAKSDFIVTVGTIEAKKNHALLYYVYKLAAERGIDLPTSVIVGRLGWKTEQIYDFMTQDPQVKDKFVFLHDVSDENLSWLYEHAKLSVFPSFAEGWGIPIAESIARGTPCVCSNTTSMIEVAEGYVQHFNPASSDECLTLIQEMLTPENQKKWRDKCATYKQTTWDQSYEQVRAKMQEIAHV
ncbi:MAG: glycosyltransferase [Candidatus Saccharibacteria bacterium]|nr:glycosyltransferase [Candidatus Saccharibacteria bacterium]